MADFNYCSLMKPKDYAFESGRKLKIPLNDSSIEIIFRKICFTTLSPLPFFVQDYLENMTLHHSETEKGKTPR